MPEENISPEERLFRVMQKEKETSAAAQVPPTAAGASAKGSFFQKVGQLLPKGGAGAQKASPGAQGAGSAAGMLDPLSRLQGLKQLFVDGIDLTAVNRVSTLILVALVAWGIMLATDQNPSIQKLMGAISRIRFEQFQTQDVEVFQAMDYYLNQVRTRDIFSLPEEVVKQVEQPEPPPPAPSPPPKPQLKELAQGLKIVGIAWGETPKAMIQNGAAQEVYFLKEGELIGKTEIQIKRILRDKVVVTYNGEEMEL
ncbi:MAG: hypothetical protein HZA28_04605 [Candidatus Omnitrophica bacterium]|nr:hypothetical protein [Candidatus Omnitrophota bacterium]